MNRIKAELRTNPGYWATVAVFLFPPLYVAGWFVYSIIDNL